MSGRTALASLGQEAVYLSNNPEVTYFRELYKRTTKWSTRIDEVIFDPDGQYFGGETFVHLPKSGDIISKIYLKIQNPGVFGTSNILDSAGTLMVNFADLYIGNQLVDRQWGEFIEMKNDLEISASKQFALSKLVGKNLSNVYTGLQTYTIELPFYILKKGLPACAFDSPVIVRIGFNPVSKFCPSVTKSVSLNASLYVEYVYLDKPERNFIKNNNSIYLNEHCQLEQFFVPAGVTQAMCKTQFSNPVKEIFIVIQEDSALGYDYGKDDKLVSMSLDFNNVTHISSEVGTPTFLRMIQPLEFHTRQPDRLFYMYSFSIDPQSDQPTTHVNFSRIINQNFNFKLVENSGNLYIRIYALAYNFVNVNRGNAEVLFSNYES